MLKASGQDGDGEVLVLGLSFANLTRLKAGDPIVFDAKPYGYDGKIMIFSGRDERVMGQMLLQNSPDAKVHVEKDVP